MEEEPQQVVNEERWRYEIRMRMEFLRKSGFTNIQKGKISIFGAILLVIFCIIGAFYGYLGFLIGLPFCAFLWYFGKKLIRTGKIELKEAKRLELKIRPWLRDKQRHKRKYRRFNRHRHHRRY